MNIRNAIERLNRQLPLKDRQNQLTPAFKKLHQVILSSLVEHGQAPSLARMAEITGDDQLAPALRMLGELDLVVLSQEDMAVVGAYPVTIETTPHILSIGTVTIYAMCALDAVSVAPLFDCEVEITSQCHVSGVQIHIHMRGHDVLAVVPENVMVGIRWQMPVGAAAHSMCTEMVLLGNKHKAYQWQAGDVESISLFDLPDAIAFGSAFFLPLLE